MINFGRYRHFIKLDTKKTLRSLFNTIHLFSRVKECLVHGLEGRGVLPGAFLQARSQCWQPKFPFDHCGHALVNSSSAHPSPGLTPGFKHFFNWKIPQVGTQKLSKCPGVGMKEGGKMPHPQDLRLPTPLQFCLLISE